MSEPTVPLPAIEWIDDRDFRLGDLRFSCITVYDRVNPSDLDHFVMVKPRESIERYVELLARAACRAVLELGIHRGGSTIFFERLLRPDLMVAVDLMPGPCLSLESFIDRCGLGSVYSIHYGIDQADAAALDRILSATGLVGDLDLVIDDASHRFGPTRDAFTTLFPHLRPGGIYVIEDWAWGQSKAQFVAPEAWRASPALGVLLFECISANAAHPDVIADVTVGPGFATLTRGEAVLDPAGFALEDYYFPKSRGLVERMLAAWPAADSP